MKQHFRCTRVMLVNANGRSCQGQQIFRCTRVKLVNAKLCRVYEVPNGFQVISEIGIVTLRARRGGETAGSVAITQGNTAGLMGASARC